MDQHKQLDRVMIKTDSKLVADSIASHENDSSEFGAVIDSCRVILQFVPIFGSNICNVKPMLWLVDLARMSKDFSFTYV